MTISLPTVLTLLLYVKHGLGNLIMTIHVLMDYYQMITISLGLTEQMDAEVEE